MKAVPCRSCHNERVFPVSRLWLSHGSGWRNGSLVWVFGAWRGRRRKVADCIVCVCVCVCVCMVADRMIVGGPKRRGNGFTGLIFARGEETQLRLDAFRMHMFAGLDSRSQEVVSHLDSSRWAPNRKGLTKEIMFLFVPCRRSTCSSVRGRWDGHDLKSGAQLDAAIISRNYIIQYTSTTQLSYPKVSLSESPSLESRDTSQSSPFPSSQATSPCQSNPSHSS
jgi:hypothetical protein